MRSVYYVIFTLLVTVAFPIAFECERDVAFAFIGRDEGQGDTSFIGEPDFYPTLVNELCKRPIMPERAARERVRGRVRVQLLVDTLGQVKEYRVIGVEPEGYGFREAVEEVICDWRFHPATQSGRPIECWIAIPFKFRPPIEAGKPE